MLRTSPRKTTNKYSSAQNSPERVMRRLIRKRLLDKVRNAAIEKNPANANNKKQGKQQSKRNEKEVPKRGVANNIKGKKVASTSKVGRGKPKRDDDSEGTPEGNKEDAEEDDEDYEYHEEEAEEDSEAEDEDEYERGRVEAVVDGAIVDSSSNEEEEEEDDDDDPIMVMDREQYGHTGNVKKRKQRPGERDDWARSRAPGHTVGVPRTSNQPTGHTVGGGANVPTGHTVGRDAALSDHHLDGIVQVRGMSKTESMRNRQKHVADRVRAFVKASVFRRIKFINSDIMFQKAFKLVIDQEAVPPHQRGQFQMLYESVFNESLNTKRSSCEQAGGKIVRESIAIFKDQGEEEFFTIDELCKLRRATTERERKAFFWFFGTYLECVCGRRSWGKQKQYELVSKATEEGGRGKLVTKSDEAFALLLFDNYIEKWKKLTTMDVSDEGQEKQGRQRGKYTGKKVDIASMEGGAVTELLASTSCTTWLLKTGRAHKRRQWKQSCLHFVEKKWE